jgi:hypothetical protein
MGPAVLATRSPIIQEDNGYSVQTRKWQVSDPVANETEEDNMDTANFLIIIVTILVLGGSARYFRGHWF